MLMGATMKSGETGNANCLTYTVPEAGALIGLTKNRSYEAAARGELPVIRIGRLIRVPKAALHAMLEKAGAGIASA